MLSMNLHDLCKQILEVDNSIRFAGISNKFGKQMAAEYRKGLLALLTEYEIEQYAIKSLLRMASRKDREPKLGKPIYSHTLYEKVKQATIPLDSEEYPILTLSFNKEADHQSIILNKILPIVKKCI